MNEANTNDTLGGAAAGGQNVAPAATPAQNTQAVSETSSGEVSTPVQSPEEKLFAGKYKTPEELEKGYLESQKLIGNRKELEDQATLLKELADASGLTVDEIRQQIGLRKQEKEMSAEGIKDPALYELKKKVSALEAEKVIDKFERDFEQLTAKKPELKGAHDVLRKIYMSEKDKPLQQIIDEVYSPVVQQATNQATQILDQKEAANVQSAEGSGPVVDDREANLVKEAKKSFDNDSAILELLKHRGRKKS